VRDFVLITVSFPWNKAHASGRASDVLIVNVQDSDLDGAVCTEGKAVSLLSGDTVKLPPYISARDIPAYVGGLLGADHGFKDSGRLD
jgi:hypothetical protein